MNPQPDQGWILDQLSTLTEHADDLRSLSSTVNEFRPWTAAKLTMLAASVDVYTKNILHRFEDVYYIDALAGSGVVDVTGHDTTLVGSPIIAATLAHEPGFDKIFCVEMDAEKASALRARLEYLSNSPDFELTDDGYEVIQGDANVVIPELVERLKRERGGHWRGAHHLAFLDNLHVDIEMRTISALSDMWNDMLITLQTPNIQTKVTGGVLKNYEPYDRFFGGTLYRSLTKAPQFRDHYCDKLAGPPINRPMQRVVNIRGSEKIRFNYDLVYASRETEGGSPWIRFADGMKRRLDGLSSEKIGQVLDQLQGKAAPLSVFSDDGPGLEYFDQ